MIRQRIQRAVTCALALMLILMYPCSTRAKPNVLLISIDTLRADHLSCYGYTKIQTPHIDSLAHDGIRFASHYTPVPITLPSHATLLTGLYPSEHGVRSNGCFRLKGEEVTLPELLQQEGYKTGAFIGAYVMHSRFGLSQGFDSYDENFGGDASDSLMERMQKSLYVERRAGDIVNAAQSWLQQRGDQPFFLFIHCFDPHAPYDAPAPYTTPYETASSQGRIVSAYDGEIIYTDACLGRLFHAMRQMGIYDNTIICVTSDHGEGLGEHGEDTHAFFVYDSTLHVPLIIRFPEKIKKGQVEKRITHNADIAPSILYLLGINIPDGMHGEALLDKKADRANVYYFETHFGFYNHGWSALEGIRKDGWKYIYAPKPELYNMENDPKELVNVYDTFSERASLMNSELACYKKRYGMQVKEDESRIPLDDEMREKLKSLGYIWTPVHEKKPLDLHPDPKDKLGELKVFLNGLSAYQSHNYSQAIVYFTNAVTHNPFDTESRKYLAFTYSALNEGDRAIEELEKILESDPDRIDVHLMLGAIYRRLSKNDAAEKKFKEILALDTEELYAYEALGSIFYNKGEYDKALDYFMKGAVIAPMNKKPGFLNNSGIAYYAQGLYAHALTMLNKALEIDPCFIPAYNNLAKNYLALHMREQARATFEKAISLDPNYHDARINLAGIYIQEKKCKEAHAHLERAFRSDPAITMAPMIDFEVEYVKTGQLECAIELYHTLLSHTPILSRLLEKIFVSKSDPEIVCDFLKASMPFSHEKEDKRSLSRQWYNLGCALWRKRDYERAGESYEWATKLDPNFALPYNNMAWMLATSEDRRYRDVQRAIRYAERAVELERNENFLDTLAIAYAEAHDFKRALRASEEAYKLSHGTNKEIKKKIEIYRGKL
ncbi:MAG: sulfatase-like hydrolase/transferase [bacterium]